MWFFWSAYIANYIAFLTNKTKQVTQGFRAYKYRVQGSGRRLSMCFKVRGSDTVCSHHLPHARSSEHGDLAFSGPMFASVFSKSSSVW